MAITLELQRQGNTKASADAIVEAHGLVRRYGSGEASVEALRDVSLSIPRAELTVIMGPSGSGKSTLLHLLAGLDRPDAGTIEIEGEDITRLGDAALTSLRRRIGFVFQFFNLLPMLTAEENILLPLAIAGQRPDQARVDELTQAVGVEHRRDRRPAQLSGGEQQRVSIARALVTRPAVVFADEPTGNLDSVRGKQILELLHDSVHAYGQTIVLVTHDARVAVYADRVLLLADGRIVSEVVGANSRELLARRWPRPQPPSRGGRR